MQQSSAHNEQSVPVVNGSTTITASEGEGATAGADATSQPTGPRMGSSGMYPNGQDPRLRYKEPYWFPYQTFVKERWRGRQLLEVISTEFRDRSVEYYRHALESGVTRINGVIASPLYVLKGGDRLENTVHRHEPPVANDPVKILHLDKEREFMVISKPGSVPVHATGRYMCHTVLDLLESDHGIHAYAVNRLDRLTSGLMILALSSASSRELANEFHNREIKKEYVARVRGRFPEEEILVDQPMMTVDRQMGLVIVTPEGKDARTVFKRMSYDAERDQSVVRCFPQTGRTHQIRVHLQYLGHPIANDPLYSSPAVWGSDVGKGGVDLNPEDNSIGPEAILAGRNLAQMSISASSTPASSGVMTPQAGEAGETKRVSAMRDTENIDLASPIRLSKQAKDIITRLRRLKDEAEDWIKWKEIIFNPDSATATSSSSSTSLPTVTNTVTNDTPSLTLSSNPNPDPSDPSHPSHGAKQRIPLLVLPRIRGTPPRANLPADFVSPLRKPAHLPQGFCPDCFVPLPDDPDPEGLFIYLHALSYTTERLGKWSTPLPRWAGEEWDGDWRGWVDGQEEQRSEERGGGQGTDGAEGETLEKEVVA